MSKRTHTRGQAGRMRTFALTLASVFAAALVLAVACAAQTQTAEGSRASEKKAAGAATGEKAASPADASKSAPAVAAAPKVGEPAPDFKLPYATQEKIFMKPDEQMSLSSLKGKNVVLAFYPADWSGGCTAEVCTFRDTFMEFGKLNAVVLGVSGDYVFSHHEWAKHHKLPFALLSDHDHRVARAYDSFNEQYGFNKRTVYLIDKDGVVRYVNPAFKANDKKDYVALRAELEKLK
ncbi:MAG TPA: peroxiredoxin [Pyrinomonadaceae bacterium]|nr:peroxiredoxin [Pyrinomonadaceae bacterium]